MLLESDRSLYHDFMELVRNKYTPSHSLKMRNVLKPFMNLDGFRIVLLEILKYYKIFEVHAKFKVDNNVSDMENLQRSLIETLNILSKYMIENPWNQERPVI